MLDEQAKQGTAVFEAQTKHQKDYLVSQAEQQYEMEKKQYDMQMNMQKEMEKFQGQGPLPFTGLTSTFSTMPQMAPTMAPAGGQVYEYGPNGELVPKGEEKK